MVKNLNDLLFDDQPYSTRGGDRNHLSYVLSDEALISRLQDYPSFEDELVKSVLERKKKIYLRFCDGEYLYYKRETFVDLLVRAVKFLLGRKEVTCWGESIRNNRRDDHFRIFRENRGIVKFCPMFSDAFLRPLKTSMLYQVLLGEEKIGHLYYVYYFLNRLRQGRVERLRNIRIVYVTHRHYIERFDHVVIGPSYDDAAVENLRRTDFSKYDLVLLGGGISSPLYSEAIAKTASCPIIDSGYMLSIWESTKEFHEGPYTHKFTN